MLSRVAIDEAQEALNKASAQARKVYAETVVPFKEAYDAAVARYWEAHDKDMDRYREVRDKAKKEDDAKILEIAEKFIYQPTDFEEYNEELRKNGFKERTPPEEKPHG